MIHEKSQPEAMAHRLLKLEPPADGQNLNVRVLTTLESLEKLRPAWERIALPVSSASIFSSWEWLAPWWRAFGADQQLHVLAFEDMSSRLVGLAPLSSACTQLRKEMESPASDGRWQWRFG